MGRAGLGVEGLGVGVGSWGVCVREGRWEVAGEEEKRSISAWVGGLLAVVGGVAVREGGC
jgi:hypothetical protein